MSYCVSVLVPMYNTEKYIGRCIESILNQTYENLDIILVDDGSKDNTYEIASRYQKQDSRIRLLQKENEKNVSKTRNFLLDNIKGEYFVFIDSDDFVEKEYIELLLNTVMYNDSDAAMVDYQMQIAKLPLIKKVNPKINDMSNYEALSKIVLESFPSSFMLWNKIYKTSILGDLRFNSNCKYGEDFEFVVHFFAKCKNVAFFNQSLYHYMVRPGSEMRSGFGKKHIDFIRVLDEDISTEEDYKVRHILECWCAFASAGFLVEAKLKGYKEKTDLEFLKEIAIKYEDSLLNEDSVNIVYQKLFKSIRLLEL